MTEQKTERSRKWVSKFWRFELQSTSVSVERVCVAKLEAVAAGETQTDTDKLAHSNNHASQSLVKKIINCVRKKSKHHI